MRIEDFLLAAERRVPDRTALVSGETHIDYRRLAANAARLANVLRRRRICRGERVAIFLGDSADAVIALFAALEAGAVISIIDPATGAEKLAALLNDCGAKALITERALLPVVAEALRGASSVTEKFVAPFEDVLHSGADIAPPNAGVDLDLAALVYAGEGGKGAMHTHRGIVFAADALASLVNAEGAHAALGVPCLSAPGGLYRLLAGIRLGATLTLGKSLVAAIAPSTFWLPECGPCLLEGAPIRGAQACVVSRSGARVPQGAVGELVVRGMHVMQGYWGNPEASARRLRAGHHPWDTVLHTGQLVRAGEDGRLQFVDAVAEAA